MTITPEQFNKLALKEDIDQILDAKLEAKLTPMKSEILQAIDSLAKSVNDLRSESAANLAAHDRFEVRITNLENKVL
jgi:hypothetical protein